MFFRAETTTQQRVIAVPTTNDDLAYMAFMQRMLSTQCEFLKTAIEKGNIVFADVSATSTPEAVKTDDIATKK